MPRKKIAKKRVASKKTTTAIRAKKATKTLKAAKTKRVAKTKRSASRKKVIKLAVKKITLPNLKNLDVQGLEHCIKQCQSHLSKAYEKGIATTKKAIEQTKKQITKAKSAQKAAKNKNAVAKAKHKRKATKATAAAVAKAKLSHDKVVKVIKALQDEHNKLKLSAPIQIAAQKKFHALEKALLQFEKEWGKQKPSKKKTKAKSKVVKKAKITAKPEPLNRGEFDRSLPVQTDEAFTTPKLFDN